MFSSFKGGINTSALSNLLNMVFVKDITKIWNGGEKRRLLVCSNKISIDCTSTIDFQPFNPSNRKPSILNLHLFHLKHYIYEVLPSIFFIPNKNCISWSSLPPKTLTIQITLFPITILFKHGEGRKKFSKLGRSGTINFRIVSKIFKLSQVGDHYWRRINPVW